MTLPPFEYHRALIIVAEEQSLSSDGHHPSQGAVELRAA